MSCSLAHLLRRRSSNAIWEAHGKPLHVILANGVVNLSYRKRIDPQHRHDHSQGVVALAELIAEVNATKLAVERAEAELCEAQRLLPVKEVVVAELDARHRAMVAELIRPLRAVAADRYRAAASDLRTARNLYCDIGLFYTSRIYTRFRSAL